MNFHHQLHNRNNEKKFVYFPIYQYEWKATYIMG